MSTTVHRDPFARGAYRRFTLSNTDRAHQCLWCGQKPRRLSSYVWERDDGQTIDHDNGEWFCTFDCFRSAIS